MNTEVITLSQRFPISGYLKLTKPSIIYLLVLTSATAMFLAEGFSGNLLKVVLGLLGIGLIASSSAAINQILDVEVDSTTFGGTFFSSFSFFQSSSSEST